MDVQESDTGGRMSANGLIGTWSAEELYRAEQLLRQLEKHPGWDILVGLVNIEREGLIRAMTSGLKPLAHVDYAYKGGRANGLHSMRAIVATVYQKAERVRKQLAGDDADDGGQT